MAIHSTGALLLVAVALAPVVAAGGADTDRTEATRDLTRLIAESRPIPFPNVDPSAPRSTGPARLVTRDLLTGETLMHEGPGPLPTERWSFTPHGEGAAGRVTPPVPGYRDKNFNPWSFVDDPASGTYPRRVKIWASFRDITDTLRTFVGSGTLIDSRHVITCAHVIYQLFGSSEFIFPDPWAETVTVAPAYENGNTPLGTAGASQLHSWSNYTQGGDADHDIGVITLDRHVGALTGWWGYGYNTDYDYFGAGTWIHEGYPAEDPFDGEFMYENAGNFDETPISGWDYRIGFFMPSWGGSSGSGARRDGAVYAVLSGSNRINHTEDVMLTPTKFSHIQGWVSSVTPSGYDLVPMFVQTTGAVAAGGSLGFLDFILHNSGSAWCIGDFDYTVRLSPDADITASDLYLGSGTISVSIPDKNSELINLPAPNVPSHVAAGDWFVGVIIEASDANPGNNDTSGQEAAPLAVTCADAPQAPILTAPNDGAICRPRDNLYLSWSDLGSGDEYEIQVGTSPASGPVYTASNQSTLTLNGLPPSTTYYWRVRGRLGCGTWGPFSTIRSFRTEPNLFAVSTLVAPAEDTHCLPASVGLQWTALPDAAAYQVQISSNWCYEGAITTDIAGTSHTVTGLLPNTTYYWRVRAQTVCGDLTDWSSVPGFCWTFKTAPTGIAPPVIVGPADGADCANHLLWNHAEDWDHYEVQIGTACGEGTVYTTSANGYWPGGLVTGQQYVWRVRTIHECGLVSDWTPCRTFTLDDVPPTNPTTLASNSHQVGVWSTDNTIDTWWDWGNDNCSGSFPQYATLWDTAPDTEPTVPTTSGEMTLETSPPLPDGQAHWFHVRTIDWAGNMAAETLHLGPFWIDTTPPEAVPDLWLCEPLDLDGDLGPLTASWNPAPDATSGVAGYSFVAAVGTPGAAVPDGVIDTAGLGAGVPLPWAGGWRFGVRAIDAAGNAGPVTETGPVNHNAALPAFTAPVCGTQVSEGQTYAVSWEPVGSATGGRMKLSVDGGATFITLATLAPEDVMGGSWSWPVPGADTDRAVLQLEVDTVFNRYTAASRFFTIIAVSGVRDDTPARDGTGLVGNYPNPFNPSTTIVYRVERSMAVRLVVYDAGGRRVRGLVDGQRTGPALHEVVWDGRSDAGLRVASGVYFCRMTTEDGGGARSMVLLE